MDQEARSLRPGHQWVLCPVQGWHWLPGWCVTAGFLPVAGRSLGCSVQPWSGSCHLPGPLTPRSWHSWEFWRGHIQNRALYPVTNLLLKCFIKQSAASRYLFSEHGFYLFRLSTIEAVSLRVPFGNFLCGPSPHPYHGLNSGALDH